MSAKILPFKPKLTPKPTPLKIVLHGSEGKGRTFGSVPHCDICGAPMSEHLKIGETNTCPLMP